MYRTRALDDEMERVMNKLGIKSGKYNEGKIVLNGATWVGSPGLRIIVTSRGKMPLSDKITRRGGSTKIVLEFTERSWEEVCEFEESLDGSMMLELLCNNMDNGRRKFIPLCKIYTGCYGGHTLFENDIKKGLGKGGMVLVHRVDGRVILVATIA